MESDHSNPGRGIAATLAWLVPLAACWVVSDAIVAQSIALAFPPLVGVFGYITKNERALRHGFQAFHFVAFVFLACVAAGLLEHPGELQWFGALGSIPARADASLIARTAFWVVAALRTSILLIFTIQTARGRDIYIPGLSEPPTRLQFR